MKNISVKKLSLKRKKKGSYLNLPKTSTKFFTTESTESWPQVHIQYTKAIVICIALITSWPSTFQIWEKKFVALMQLSS